MTWFLRKYPLFVLTICAVASAVATVRGIAHWPDSLQRLAAVLAALQLCWLLAESRVTARSSSSPETATDRGTIYLYATARTATVTTACLVPPDWTAYQPWMLALPVVFVAAVLLRLSAIRSLGRLYSHRVRVLADHWIVDTGPYNWVRHPAYVGMGLAHVVFVVFFLNPYSAAALVGLLLPALVVRILVEERMLFTLPGYSGYAASRRRLVPGIW